jgi:PAS domain S-box-containing protein
MGCRILIIDDNVSLAENLRDILSGAAHLEAEVELAPDGQTGLSSARQAAFDVAVVDVKLPDGSGVDLIPRLRATSPFLEIILLTGFATVDTAIAALRAGAAAFILKSFRPEELLAAVEQVLEKIALKREREEYAERYQALVGAADVCVVGLDASGAVTAYNPRLSDITGVSAEDATGRSFVDVFIEETDRRRMREAFSTARAGGGASEFEAGVVTAAGAVRRIRWHLSGVRDRGSDQVFGFGLDVTERRALERRVAEAEALNAMAPLALGLAHEIRNPLNAAVLELHLLSRAIGRLPDGEQRDPMASRVRIVEDEIRRLERLLTEFLELARPRSPQREPVDLTRVVSDVLDLEAEAITAHGVVLERDLTPSAFVSGDTEKLKQVVLNLVVNALDVMPEHGTLRARTEISDDTVELALSDTGPGVDPKFLAEIFDPFFTTKPAGTGLGLAIVRKIVEQHGGDVSLEARLEGGTTVRVVLPRVASPAA